MELSHLSASFCFVWDRFITEYVNALLQRKSGNCTLIDLHYTTVKQQNNHRAATGALSGAAAVIGPLGLGTAAAIGG